MRYPEEIKERARKMYSDGLTQKQTGQILGVSQATVNYWVNPARRAKCIETNGRRIRHKWATDPSFREKHNKVKQSRRRYRLASDLEYRCKGVLKDSISQAKRYGYKPCNATVEQLIEAFDGHCAICGIAESELSKRLSMDHCHSTGEFRGWLCEKHNHALGRIGDDAASVFAYLYPVHAEMYLQMYIESQNKNRQ